MLIRVRFWLLLVFVGWMLTLGRRAGGRAEGGGVPRVRPTHYYY